LAGADGPPPGPAAALFGAPNRGQLRASDKAKGLTMFIGGGLIVLIVIVILVVLLLRR
jgi:hypothetical protein